MESAVVGVVSSICCQVQVSTDNCAFYFLVTLVQDMSRCSLNRVMLCRVLYPFTVTVALLELVAKFGPVRNPQAHLENSNHQPCIQIGRLEEQLAKRTKLRGKTQASPHLRCGIALETEVLLVETQASIVQDIGQGLASL